MIDYELACALKNAGFPQTFYRGTIAYLNEEGNYKSLTMDRVDRLFNNKDLVYVPTLSELIDVCGDRFKNLSRVHDSLWACNSDVESSGSTPEEAVSRLWLALNKK